LSKAVARTKDRHADADNLFSAPDKVPAWHHFSIEDTVRYLQVDSQSGLATDDAQVRAGLHGPNRLSEKPSRSPWLLFFSQFKSILILILIFASGLAAAIGDFTDAIVILAVVTVNAVVGFYQEYRAEQSLAALKKMLPVKAHVRRDGRRLRIAADALVPGDIVFLEAGDRVPADGRLLVAHSLAIDESTLTGESQPSNKHARELDGIDVALAERANMAYMNTMVTHGRAEMAVTAIGMQTEMGRLSSQLQQTEEVQSPLQIQLDRLGKRLGAIALTLVTSLFLLEILRGAKPVDITMESIALSMAAIPEGLPVVVTVTLALGMQQMARQRAILKRLSSVETLGCTTVICSDKTGTLTLNQMTARLFFYQGRRFIVSGEGYRPDGAITPAIPDSALPDLRPLLTPMAACNDSRVSDGVAVGDPMEAALLVLASKGGASREAINACLPRIAEIPFDSEHKYMATFHLEGHFVHEFVKGAPDVLLERCSRVHGPHGEMPLDPLLQDVIMAEYKALADRGMRGLLIASRLFDAADFQSDKNLYDYVSDLTFIGLVGLMDPPRTEAKNAIALCSRAGIQVKMITGDHKDTATAIAHELGISGSTVTGTELDAMAPQQLRESIDKVAVFARVAPEHKVDIVRALQARGHVVAMTGDGVNDAPALKQADIGVAMGIAGTEVSKEAASMVLTDDNFSTIVSAVHQGRMLYDNILKFVIFQLSTTMGAIFTVFFAPFAGLPGPFTPIQILWIALIMDGPPAVSLSLDSARPGIMREAPRTRDAAVLPFSRLGKILLFGVTMMAGTLGVLYYGIRTGPELRALTLAFTTFVLFQFFNVFNARAGSGTSFNKRFFDNPMLWCSVAGVIALQVVVLNWSAAQSVFETTALSLDDWLIAFAVAFSILLLEEGRKVVLRMMSHFRRAKTRRGKP
jgi:Ca2+-transporting ATPase